MGRGRLCAALGVALLAAVLAGSAGGAGAARQGATFARNDANQQYVPGQVVVGFRPNVDPVSRLEALSDASASTLKSIGSLNAKLVSVDGSVSAAVAELKSNPAVAYAEPNWIYHAEAVPNDPRYSQTYGLPKIQAPAGLGRHHRQRCRDRCGRRHRHLQRPPRSGSEHGRGRELRHRRPEYQPRLQRPRDARRRDDRRARQQRHRRCRRQLERAPDAAARAERGRKRHAAPTSRLHLLRRAPPTRPRSSTRASAAPATRRSMRNAIAGCPNVAFRLRRREQRRRTTTRRRTTRAITARRRTTWRT